MQSCDVAQSCRMCLHASHVISGDHDHHPKPTNADDNERVPPESGDQRPSLGHRLHAFHYNTGDTGALHVRTHHVCANPLSTG